MTVPGTRLPRHRLVLVAGPAEDTGNKQRRGARDPDDQPRRLGAAEACLEVELEAARRRRWFVRR